LKEMKYFYIVFASLFIILACQEKRTIQPVVPGGNRIVLLEEFTGKGCTNCPKGSREIDNLLAIYDTNLVVVSIHAGFFANPDYFDVGTYDLRTGEGENIFTMLGPNIGYPAGVVNRTQFNGDYQHGQQAWADFIAQELDDEPRVEFTIEHEFNASDRKLSVDVEGISKVDLNGDIRVSLMITESGIVDAQDDLEAGGIVDDYVHKHVLRGMATPFGGTSIADGLELGAFFNTNLEMTMDPSWNEQECEIIVFISEVRGADDIRVLQAGIAHLVD